MRKVEITARSGQGFGQNVKAGEHSFVSDAPKTVGGEGVGPDPHELMLGALGACTSITLQMYSKRKEWDLKNVSVNLVEDEIADPKNPSGKIARVKRNIEVVGNLTEEQVGQLKAIADKCPIHKLLSGSLQIETEIARAKQAV